MTTRIVRLFAVIALSLGLVAGPLAGVSSARHRSQYPPKAGRCQTSVTRTNSEIRIRVVCRDFGINIDIRVVFRSEPLYVGTFTTDSTGSVDATVAVPEAVKPGSHHVEIFKADAVNVPKGAPQVVAGSQAVSATTLGSPLESIPLQVVETDGKKDVLTGSKLTATQASAGGSSSSSNAPLTAAAVGLVGIGATGLVVARRRRNATDAGGI
ncbi:MAG: hypothetical protein M3N68_12295 [Actinomycetota bacterium]|nr:hypothetical protein [Actinomycetota bacterium]